VFIKEQPQQEEREIMLFIGKPKGRSMMISNGGVKETLKLAWLI